MRGTKRGELFKEARRLYDLGFAVLWLKPKSKAPIEGRWTSGPRAKWHYLEETYIDGLNVGVRLGEPSQVEGRYLAVIDVDVKSKDPRHRKEATAAVNALFEPDKLPLVRSGRGNGSRHYYYTTRTPASPERLARSEEEVAAFMPSAGKPSKKDQERLTVEQLNQGYRIRPAWEVSRMGQGQQVVLPPSVHPDSGNPYTWKRHFKAGARIVWAKGGQDSPKENGPKPKLEASQVQLDDFKVEPVELAWLPIPENIRRAILKGEGVQDRSGYLLRAASALVSAGLTENEVLTVLTDPGTYLGACGYEHAQTSSRKRAAQWVYRYTLKKITAERQAPSVFSLTIPKPRKLSKKEQSDQADEFGEGWDWRRDIVRGDKGTPSKLVQNVVHILTNAVDDAFIRRDEFAYRDTYNCPTPWGGKKNQIVGDDDIPMIQYWLGRHYRFEPPCQSISNALVVVACQNTFDPVKHFLDTLPDWDQVPRLDTWLARNFEAKGDPEYLSQVFRKWMVAMVMRVYHPGSKFDWMPIFEGLQGIGKSSFGRLLVGDRYFLDWLPNLHDKDSALSLQGMWGVEMGELSQFRRNELETIKAFITRTVDKMRPPYGRRLVESPRRCVFFGTTNRNTYLIDETGNRRFKPLVVGNLDFNALKKDRLQLFAEAKYLFQNNVEHELTLELTGDARIFERQIHQEKMVEDDSNAMAESMKDFVEKVGKNSKLFDLKRFKIIDLFEGVGPLAKWRPEIKNMVFAGKMLKNMGAKDRFIRGRKFWKIE